MKVKFFRNCLGYVRIRRFLTESRSAAMKMMIETMVSTPQPGHPDEIATGVIQHRDGRTRIR
jgi:hypothetical protein